MNVFNKILATTLLSLTLIACGDSEDEAVKEAPIRPVKFLTVASSDVSLNSTLNGRAQAAVESKLSFLVSGTVEKLLVSVGDRLKKGQLIAQLDSNIYELKVQQALATSEQSKASSQNAKAVYQRTRNLYVNNSASKTELDNAKANADSSSASFRAAIKSLELAELDLERTRLFSNGDCQVVSVNVEVNENITSGSPILDVSCGDGIEVQVSVPESLIDQISNKTITDIRFSAIDNKVFEGRVTEVGVSSTGGVTFPVVVNVEGDTRQLRSGMAAEVTFQLDGAKEKEEVIYLPASVVLEDAEGTFVYLVVPENDESDLYQVKRQPVAPGQLSQNGLRILEGLEVRQRVVSAGLNFIYDGLIVRLGPGS